jgi:23S rRNA pseudouridine1911/1915/1917 synthase
MAVGARAGRQARSSYWALERWRDATLVELALHTGRTHQLRVHLAHLGHPVVGDLVYGRRANAHLSEISGYSAPRQLLHAWRLALRHPLTGAPLAACAPLPEDFRNALDFFRNATYY